MSQDAVVAVLGVLRRLKNTQGVSVNNSALDFLRMWAGDHSPIIILRLSIAIQNHVADAQIAIANSSLTDEAKGGLAATLTGLSQCFSIEMLQQAISSFLPALDSSITNFAIIASMMDVSFSQKTQDEIDEVISDIDSLINDLNEREFDPSLRAALVRQLYMVTAMLRNAQAVGTDAALSAFFDIILRKKDDDRSTLDPAIAEVRRSIWERIASIGDKLTKIASIAESGQKLLPYLEKIPSLLKHIPS